LPIVSVYNLTKVFRVFKRREGLIGALQNLVVREYTQVRAVDGISFEIEPGELVGYIGPNGAGKSTTIKMLCGILTPTKGCVEVNGIVPFEDRVANARQMGVLFGQRTQLWWDLAVIESFNLLKKMYEIPDEDYERNLATFSEVLQLDELLHLPVRKLSLGQRMRCDLAASLLHNPKVVYFDEPSIGLDVSVKERIRQFIKELNRQRNTTILLTTHDLGDIEEICERIIVIDHGKIIYDGSIGSLRQRFDHSRRLVFDIRGGDAAQGLHSYLQLSPQDAQAEWQEQNQRLTVTFNRNAVSASDVASMIMRRYNVIDLTVQEPDIETIVRRIYAGEYELEEPAGQDHGES